MQYRWPVSDCSCHDGAVRTSATLMTQPRASCESTNDHGALKKRKVVEVVRETDGGGRVLRKRSAADVLKDNVSDNETHCAHKRGKYEQASKAVWSECEPWRDK